MGEKKEKQGSKGHLGKVGEVNGTQSILLMIVSIILLYCSCVNEHNLLKALGDVKGNTHDGGLVKVN